MNVSIRSRLLAAASIVLAAFLGFTGIALDHGFNDSVKSAIHSRLQAHVYTMLAAAELTGAGSLFLPEQLPEPRFAAPDSGLIADVSKLDGSSVWKSRSALGIELPPSGAAQTGQWQFETVTSSEKRQYISASFVASWAGSNRSLHRFRFRVAEDRRFMSQQVLQFRRSLWSWLGGAAVFLLVAQGTILRWSLAPLKKAEEEIVAIESGHQKRLSDNYPRELSGLTQRLNILVENSENHLQRYRDSLGNLAHSLKTPLAVLRNALESDTSGENLRATADEQFRRMLEIIDHQLQRAATAGRSVMTEAQAVKPQLARLASALGKVYAEKAVRFDLVDDGSALFSGDEGDFFELAGNLLDNAYKWCRQQVRVTVNQIDDDRPRLRMVVEDDGPGIPESKRFEVLRRGSRADPATVGHGLGLDMVRETVKIYGGSLEIFSSELGGSRVVVIL